MMIVLADGTSMPVSIIVEHKEHVKALLVEVAHHVLKLAFAHLPVGNGNAGFGHKRFEPGTGVFDGVHFVMQVVDLSAALLIREALLHGSFRPVRSSQSLHGEAAFGSGGNDGEVADAFKTHRKCGESASPSA